MATRSVATDLVGSRILVTLGQDLTGQELRQKRDPNSPHMAWRRLGENGVIRAAYMKDGGLMVSVEMFNDDQLVELHADHCRVVKNRS